MLIDDLCGKPSGFSACDLLTNHPTDVTCFATSGDLLSILLEFLVICRGKWSVGLRRIWGFPRMGVPQKWILNGS